MEKQLTLTDEQVSFMLSAIQFYWNDAFYNLIKQDLGDLEKLNFGKQMEKANELIDLIENT